MGIYALLLQNTAEEVHRPVMIWTSRGSTAIPESWPLLSFLCEMSLRAGQASTLPFRLRRFA
jgi:hypothetical protein